MTTTKKAARKRKGLARGRHIVCFMRGDLPIAYIEVRRLNRHKYTISPGRLTPNFKDIQVIPHGTLANYLRFIHGTLYAAAQTLVCQLATEKPKPCNKSK
jgi:hypothetical protein